MIQVVRMHANELESSNTLYNPKEIKLRDSKKSFIMQFKYPDTTWIWSLPIKTMYLSNIEDCTKSCHRTLTDPVNIKYGVEVRIIDIVAPIIK